MKIMYLFPHPDDETFGPAPAISKQKRQGHEIYLISLTKGGATKQRFKYNYSIEQMGEVRAKEMQEVAKVLGLSDLRILDMPDSGLKYLDPRKIEKEIENYIMEIKPDIVITYAIHGISGFHDHLVIHPVVKRVFLELKEKYNYPKRLAFFTFNQEGAEKSGFKCMNFSKPEEINCIIEVEEQDMETFRKSLDCYESYKDVINSSKIKDAIENKIYFEIFGEKFENILDDLTKEIKDN